MSISSSFPSVPDEGSPKIEGVEGQPSIVPQKSAVEKLIDEIETVFQEHIQLVTGEQVKENQQNNLLLLAKQSCYRLTEFLRDRAAPDQTGEYDIELSKLSNEISQIKEEEQKKLCMASLHDIHDRLHEIYGRYFDKYQMSQLESNTWESVSLSYLEDLLGFVKQNSDEQQIAGIKKVIEQLVFADKVHRKICNRLVNVAVNDIQDKINGLNVDESMIVEGGSLGHAVLYEIVRTGPSTFSFSVLNTGLASKGTRYMRTGAHVRNYTIDEIPVEDLENPKFFSSLMKFQVPPTKLSPKEQLLSWLGIEDFMSMARIYKTINSYLLKSGAHKRPKTERLHYRAQQHGTCVCRCIDTWLASSLAESLGKAEGKAIYQQFYRYSLEQASKKLEQEGPRFAPPPPPSFFERLIQKLLGRKGPLDTNSPEYRKISKLMREKIESSSPPEYPLVEPPKKGIKSFLRKWIWLPGD